MGPEARVWGPRSHILWKPASAALHAVFFTGNTDPGNTRFRILATTKGDNYKSFFFFRFRFGKTTDVFRTNTTTGVKIIWKLNTRIAQEKNQNWPMTHEKYFFHSPTTDKINIEKIRPPTQKKIDCRPTPPFGHFWNSPK